jgi:eukaryotic-like serine/threonine-protein kinase
VKDDDVHDSAEHTPVDADAIVDDADGPTHVASNPPPYLDSKISSLPKLDGVYVETSDDEVLPAGMMVGEYKIERQVGEGGMGTVYAAVHPLIGKKAAVKVIKRALGWDRGSVARFMQEARSVNQINHPNIVDVFSFGNLPDGRCYFVMEWLAGRSLAQYLREGPLAWDETARILDQIADALEAAHEKGIVHRDLKPENVCLVPARGQRHKVKLLDFGIAKLKGGDSGVGTTQTGVVMGTPAYLSPEQARGRSVDQATDIYALGCMGYELVTGHLPFEADTAVDIIAAHLNAPVPRLEDRLPDAPTPLADLLWRMMAKKAAERPNLAEIRASLQDLLSDPATTHPLNRAEVKRTVLPESSVNDTLDRGAAPSPAPRRTMAWAPLVLLGALAVLAGYFLVSSFDQDGPPVVPTSPTVAPLAEPRASVPDAAVIALPDASSPDAAPSPSLADPARDLAAGATQAPIAPNEKDEKDEKDSRSRHRRREDTKPVAVEPPPAKPPEKPAEKPPAADPRDYTLNPFAPK